MSDDRLPAIEAVVAITTACAHTRPDGDWTLMRAALELIPPGQDRRVIVGLASVLGSVLAEAEAQGLDLETYLTASALGIYAALGES